VFIALICDMVSAFGVRMSGVNLQLFATGTVGAFNDGGEASTVGMYVRLFVHYVYAVSSVKRTTGPLDRDGYHSPQQPPMSDGVS
jgi:hypothetical protein